MIGQREHRSERPAVWDYANPRAEKRVPLRRRLRAKPARKARRRTP
ncbi:MAG TPA: hypothetical protein VEJ18_07555 [Planctomycetota bacterium]|nr:hypothetical protein [Planctomycetota bacterium]